MAPKEIRRIILQQSKRARIGHIGCALSVADIIAALYGGALRMDSPSDPERDRFVLSKGHAALALYAALLLRGVISKGDLDSFAGDGSLLGVHPEFELPGIDFSTGSLGQGLAYGAGAALAAKLGKSNRKAFVLISDGECNEGSIWETAMFAAHHRLGNLVAILDANGQQALGYTREVLDLCNMAERWSSFGWNVHELDGHDFPLLLHTLKSLDAQSPRPHMIVAKTTFGKGVSFMQNQIAWHYLPMSDSQYEQALAEVGDL